QPQRLGDRADLGERRLEVLLDVGGEGLEGRDVDHPRRLLLEGARRGGLAEEPVDADEERRQRLSRSGRRRDQRIVATGDGGPSVRLGLGGPGGKTALEPCADGGVERREAVHEPSVYQSTPPWQSVSSRRKSSPDRVLMTTIVRCLVRIVEF